MGNAHPREWAHDRRHRLKQWATGDVGRWTREARDVCLPGVPVAAILGFFANNGIDENTTGWITCSDEERAAAVTRKRFPLKRRDPSDREVYGNIHDTDLHELGPGGVEAGRVPTPVATDPDCPWVRLAASAEVAKVLGRPGVTGADWYDHIDDQCVIGVANLARHARQVRAKLADLDGRLAWGDDKPLPPWGWFATMSSWSAGTGGFLKHIERYRDALVKVDASVRTGAFLRAASTYDGDGVKHRRPSYTGVRGGQKWTAGVLACVFTQEDEEWFSDGLGDDRDMVYAALVASS